MAKYTNARHRFLKRLWSTNLWEVPYDRACQRRDEWVDHLFSRLSSHKWALVVSLVLLSSPPATALCGAANRFAHFSVP